LEITLDKQNGTEALIKIKLSQPDYQQKVEEKVRDYARKANLKGFRQGKVPMGVIKQMFGKSILVDEVNHLLSHKISDYIKEHKLRIIGEPLPNQEKARSIDWDTDHEFEFEYQIGMVADFTYDLSQKVKVNAYPIETDDKVIEETIADLRKRFGKISYPEISEPGDHLTGELYSADGTVKKESAFIPTDKLSKKALNQFTGKKKDDTIEFEAGNIFEKESDGAQLLELTAEELRNNQEKFKFKVTTISRVEPAELSVELYDRVFGKDTAATQEEFVNKIRETITGNYSRETDHFLDHHIEDYYISHTHINLPETFLKTWLKATSKGEITEEVLTKEFEAYLRSLKWDLIKSKIAEDHNIQVNAEEVKSRARELILSQFGGPAVAGQLMDKLDAITDNYLSHENGQNFMRLYNQLRHDKILKLIREKITITEKKVSLDEFRKMVEEHRH
jgi:trigger factor